MMLLCFQALKDWKATTKKLYIDDKCQFTKSTTNHRSKKNDVNLELSNITLNIKTCEVQLK